MLPALLGILHAEQWLVSHLDLGLTGVESLKAVLPEKLPAQYPYLEYLQIVGTGLSGTFPAAWFSQQAWPFLRQFDFDSNPALQGALLALHHRLCMSQHHCDSAIAFKVTHAQRALPALA